VAYVKNKDVAGAYDAVADILASKTLPKVQLGLERLANEGFPNLTKSAKDSMQVMDKEVISKLDDFGDRMARIGTSLKTMGAGIAGAIFNVADVAGALAGSAINKLEGRGFFEGMSGAFGSAKDGEKALETMRKVTTAAEVAFAQVEKEKKAEKEKEDARAKMVKENEEAAAKAMKLKKAEDEAEQKRMDLQNKQARDLYDAEEKLVKAALARAKAQGQVTSEFEQQLIEIQKMAGAGQGGFKATSTGGKQGTTTVAALENAVANAKKAVEFAYKNINDEEGSRNLVMAQELQSQMEKNLLKAQNAQGIGSPVEILISGLDFTSLKSVADMSFGSREQNAMDKELLAVARKNHITTEELAGYVKVIKKYLEE
jgi:hypothetical protein